MSKVCAGIEIEMGHTAAKLMLEPNSKQTSRMEPMVVARAAARSMPSKNLDQLCRSSRGTRRGLHLADRD